MLADDKCRFDDTSSVSRRNFLRVAVGSLIALPLVEGGYIVPADPAYAYTTTVVGAEEDGGDSLEPITKITLVSASQVGFVVVNAADGGKTRISGAKVHIVSRYNKKSLDGTTNADGEVLFDVRNLAENPDGKDVDKLDDYSFNGTVSVTAKGYREFQIDLVRINGGSGIMAPTRTLTDAMPYPRKVSFDDWDILYSKNAFMRSPKNSDAHTIDMEFKQLGSGEATVTLKMTKDGSTVLSTKGTPKSGTLSVHFSGKYLLTDDAAAFSTTGTEDDLDNDAAYEAFTLELSQGANSYKWPLHLMVYEGEIKEEVEKTDAGLKPLNTINTSNTGLIAQWPSDLPIVGGGQITSFMPDLMFNLSLNPWGMLQFTAKTPSWGYRNDSGGDSPKGWGKYPRKSASDQYTKAFEKVNKMHDLAASAYGGQKLRKPIKTFSQISFTLWAQIVGVAQWDIKKHRFNGVIAGQVFVEFNYSITWDFWAGVVPITINFTFKATAVVSLSGGLYTIEEKGANGAIEAACGDNWHTDFTNTGLTITFNLVPTLSAGVGVSGIASISLRGRFILTLVFGISVSKKVDPTGKKNHHEVFGYSADIQVVLSFFLFTATIPIKQWKYRNFYDNWKGGLQSQSENIDNLMAQATEDGMAGLIEKMNPITAAMLGETSEFEGLSAQSGLEAQAADSDGQDAAASDEAFDWESVRKPDKKVALDDGQVITYAVYRIKPDDEMDDEELAAERDALQAASFASVAAQGDGSSQEGGSNLGLQAATLVGSPSSKRSVLKRRSSDVVYRPVRRASQGLTVQDDGTKAILMTPGVAGLGAQGGIRPSSDKVIAENVFGDPRVKIVDLHTESKGVDLRATCSFRIGSVSVDGKMRTRIIMTFVDVSGTTLNPDDYIGTSQVLDFPLGDDVSGFNREDLFDYDFDIAYSSSGETDKVHLVAISGKRADGDDTEFSKVATDLVFSYLNFRVSDVFNWRPTEDIVKSSCLGDDDGMYHSISNVRCVTDGTVESNIILVAYLDGVADTPDKLFSGDYGISNVRVSFAIIDQEEETWSAPRQSDIDKAIGDIESNGIYSMGLTPRIAGSYTLTLTSKDKTSFVVLKLDDEEGAFSSIKKASVLEDSMRLLPWLQQDCYLTTYPKPSYVEEMKKNNLWDKPDEWDRTQWVLQKANWTEVDGTPVMEFEVIGPDSFNIENFGINNAGTFIFWPQVRSGGDDRRIYDDAGNYETINEDDLFQLMACRVYNGIFSQPFVAADLPHDLSTVEIIASRDSLAPLEVLSIEPLQGDDRDKDGNPINHAVNVWYTAIPHLKCATAVGCLAPVPFVAPGGTLKFYVTIRNDGNSYLAGCTVQLCVHASKDGTEAKKVEGSTAQITFGKDTLVESHYNPIGDDGEFENVEFDFALAPGKSSIYTAYVPVPKGWTGEKYVSFVANNPVLAAGGGLTTQSEEDNEYQVFEIEPGTYKPFEESATSFDDRERRHMACIEVSEASAAGEGLADAPLSYRVQEYYDDTPGKSPRLDAPPLPESDVPGVPAGDGGALAKGAPSATRGASPNAGDSLPGALGLGLAAAGAVGAAVVAYERRRAENEAAEGEEG